MPRYAVEQFFGGDHQPMVTHVPYNNTYCHLPRIHGSGR
jgi:hypothetical protein